MKTSFPSLLLLGATASFSAACSSDFCKDYYADADPDVNCDGAGGSSTQSGSTATTMSGSMTTATMMQSSSSTGPMPTCIPSDPAWTPSDECGVFVAVGGMGAGTRDAPMGSVVDAVAAAAAIGKPVYVSDGTYTGAVTLASGQILYGGLTAQWAFDGELRPVITAAADQIPMRLIAGAGETGVHHVKVEAMNAEAVGGSSIAMLIEDTPSVLESVDLVAGNGQNGMSTMTPTDNIGPTSPTDTDIAGVSGSPAATMAGNVIEGPSGPSNPVCGGSVGGKGGDGGDISGVAEDGVAGQVFVVGCGGQTCGLGGDGEDNAGFLQCVRGEDGRLGDLGDDGVAATGPGSLDASGYVPPPPAGGMDGTPGQGGGGGGGAMGRSTPDARGASGGSGGAGGCGGKGAAGGSGGGSSIGLVALGATPALDTVNVTVAGGGTGGDSAAGQLGATGGNGGGPGLRNMISGLVDACDGGKGGTGGDGGAGAGGRGGHAIGIAFNGTAPTDGFTVVSKGAGGAGGMSPVNAGVMGESQDVLDFVP